jgi:hypothetical protein
VEGPPRRRNCQRKAAGEPFALRIDIDKALAVARTQLGIGG